MKKPEPCAIVVCGTRMQIALAAHAGRAGRAELAEELLERTALGEVGHRLRVAVAVVGDRWFRAILTLTETTAPLTWSTTSAKDAGPAEAIVAAATAG